MAQSLITWDWIWRNLAHSQLVFTFTISVEGVPPVEKKYGRLLIVDFDNFLKNNGDIEMRVDNKFDSNEDYIEKISVISKSKMACALMSGKILIRNIISSGCSSITFMDSLTIPCPEALQVVVH